MFFVVFVDCSETLMVGCARLYVGTSIRSKQAEDENAGKQIDQTMHPEWRATADVTSRVTLKLRNPKKRCCSYPWRHSWRQTISLVSLSFFSALYSQSIYVVELGFRHRGLKLECVTIPISAFVFSAVRGLPRIESMASPKASATSSLLAGAAPGGSATVPSLIGRNRSLRL
jgi:hypothetical protein